MAVVRGELGAERVEAAIRTRRCAVSAVNRAEMHARLLRDMGSVRASVVVEWLELPVVPFTKTEATLAGELVHRHRGVLSLGDAACIATAKSLCAGVMTAVRAWADPPPGVPVQLIRG